MGAKEEMVRVDATPLIAAMADVHAGRDRPMLEFPGQAMGELNDVLAGQLAIAVVIQGCLPDQAARDGIPFGVTRQALLRCPGRRTGRILPGSN
jgi:hypothetical protein